ncbi:hypothetical protein Pint_34356 [Pistacia integerrima]|uniref:Uncharacterized protein n=1 Tax=Pistacia integerrima TaxID=434235 RepID=A0ACC0X3W0_9ROSI|nr:hypothetical protein Pint_34356 [Pistacia integerrima]
MGSCVLLYPTDPTTFIGLKIFLSSDIIPKSGTRGNNVRGFDIGTGANCIYPLLGASLLRWSFVGSDVTDVALEWAEKNIKSNPQILELIEIRKVESCQNTSSSKEPDKREPALFGSKLDLSGHLDEEAEPLPSPSFDQPTAANKSYHGPPVLAGVVRDGEKFDFCMCNPPFFETMEEAGLNPKTSCGGTPEEMVCPGGERAFITRIIEDSVELKQTFRWYTSMVGRKLNLKFLISKLREVRVTIVKTTEFVQGQTYRWGLAWSFVPPAKKIVSTHVAEKKNLSFMLEGVQRQFSAIDVLHSIESFFCTSGASCKLNASSFTIDITALKDHCNAILKNEVNHVDETASGQNLQETSNSSSCLDTPNSLCFRVSVFQQIPGTLLVKGSLHRDSVRPALRFDKFAAHIMHSIEKFWAGFLQICFRVQSTKITENLWLSLA